MIRLNKKILCVLVLLVLNHCLFAQTYQYKCPIDTVRQTGFYKIILSPVLSRYCKTDFADIRISDTGDQPIPYIIRESFPSTRHTLFSQFPILKYALTDSGRSLLILENKTTGGLFDLSLLIKNSAVSRFAILSGSNDKKHWFIIEEHLLIGGAQVSAEDNYIQSFQFPLSNYKFFKLLINNVGTDPLDIQKAGIYTNSYSTNIHYLENLTPAFTQKDSMDGKSYIKILNPGGFQFDNIKIGVTGIKFFSRNAALFLPVNDSSPDKIAAIPIASFQLQPGDSTFTIPRQKAKVLYLIITNNDNAPLEINNIATRQRQNEIVIYLKKDKQYFLFLDNPLAAIPNYDLEKFKDSIPPIIDSVMTDSVTMNKQIIPVVTAPISDNKTVLWIMLSLAGLLLTFFTFRLTKEMKRSEK